MAYDQFGGGTTGAKRLTPFGEKCREVRKEKGILLMEMADVLGVSPGFLSSVETGRKAIPDGLVSKLVKKLDLSPRSTSELVRAAALSAKEYKITIGKDASLIDRALAQRLESNFAKLSVPRKQKILKLLEED